MRLRRQIFLGQWLLLACAISCPAWASDSFGRDLETLFKEAHAQKTDLARFVYLDHALRQSPPEQYNFALQLYAFTENELGLYNEALRDYPLRSAPIDDLTLPQASEWDTANAATTIAEAVGSHRLVMVNEAHHDAHTRQLTLALLAQLRRKGFKYFAAEALAPDENLHKRGYPVQASGSEYIHEPLYGEIIRNALRLGYTVVAYEGSQSSVQGREEAQARNLFDSIFRRDPEARVFVHAGYAHIDKKAGRLGKVRPMGMLLGEMIGEAPFSIDQTQFREQFPNTDQEYLQLIHSFQPKGPSVLVKKGSGEVWSAAPALYDVSVILPMERKSSLESGALRRQVILRDVNRPFPMVAHVVDTQRPEWLALGGRRHAYPVRSYLCKVVIPCVVEARYEEESDDAVPADRYAFIHPNSATDLYLFPGKYRLSAFGAEGQLLSERMISVKP